MTSAKPAFARPPRPDRVVDPSDLAAVGWLGWLLFGLGEIMGAAWARCGWDGDCFVLCNVHQGWFFFNGLSSGLFVRVYT